ncbi:MAG: S9 family peptidase [Saprospiraceae bacterium]
MKTILIIFSFLSLSLVHAQSNWSPEQCLQLKNITATIASPDGAKVLYSVREAIMTEERSEYVNQIWLCNADGSNQTQLTRGDKNNANPAWSPDGKWISFTSNRDGKTNLYSMPVTGGESEKLTDVKSGIANYAWNPDGNSIAFSMADAVSDQDEKNKKGKNDWYFVDEEIKQNRLFILNLNKKDTAGKYAQKKLVNEEVTVNDFNWSPDGKQLVYSYSKSPKANDEITSDISLINVETGISKPISSTPKAGESNPIFSPDGSKIVFYASTDPIDWSGPEMIKVYNLADGKITRLKSGPNDEGQIIGWTADSKNIIYSEANKTLTSIYILSVDGTTVTEWSKGETDLITGVTLNDKNNKITFLKQNPSSLAEAFITGTSTYAPVKLTTVQAGHSGKPLPKTEVIKWKGADGREIEGLLTYPLNYVAGQKVPFILNVHGGPSGVFVQNCVVGNSGAYPIAAFAEQGYAILRPNPRGSTGYGADFRMANRSDWGGKDYIDIMNGVDQVIKMGVADSARMGVMGWSYGGFMSSWIVGHTNRFKVASIGAPVVDLVNQNLTDDINGFLPSYFKADPWNDWATYDAHSPLRFVQNVKTPVLLQHCEGDQRVPITNGLMFYNALKRRNVTVRMLAMPRQAHGPVEPKMNLKVFETNVEWMNKYIGGKGKS